MVGVNNCAIVFVVLVLCVTYGASKSKCPFSFRRRQSEACTNHCATKYDKVWLKTPINPQGHFEAAAMGICHLKICHCIPNKNLKLTKAQKINFWFNKAIFIQDLRAKNNPKEPADPVGEGEGLRSTTTEVDQHVSQKFHRDSSGSDSGGILQKTLTSPQSSGLPERLATSSSRHDKGDESSSHVRPEKSSSLNGGPRGATASPTFASTHIDNRKQTQDVELSRKKGCRTKGKEGHVQCNRNCEEQYGYVRITEGVLKEWYYVSTGSCKGIVLKFCVCSVNKNLQHHLKIGQRFLFHFYKTPILNRLKTMFRHSNGRMIDASESA